MQNSFQVLDFGLSGVTLNENQIERVSDTLIKLCKSEITEALSLILCSRNDPTWVIPDGV